MTDRLDIGSWARRQDNATLWKEWIEKHPDHPLSKAAVLHASMTPTYYGMKPMEPEQAIQDIIPEIGMLQHVYAMTFEDACDTILAELVAKRLKGKPELPTVTQFPGMASVGDAIPYEIIPYDALHPTYSHDPGGLSPNIFGTIKNIFTRRK